MKIESPDVVFKLKAYVKLEESEHGLTLRTVEGRWLISENYDFDLEVLKKEKRFTAREENVVSKELFKKGLKEIVDRDLIEVWLSSGLIIQSISWSHLKKLLSAQTAMYDIQFNSFINLNCNNNQIQFIDTKNETVACIDQSKFFDMIRGNHEVLRNELSLLGFFDKTSDQLPGENISNAFHILNSRDLEPKREPEFRLSLPWKGTAELPDFKDDDFTKTLRLRRSYHSGEKTILPSLENISELLSLTYGAHTNQEGVSKFFYPSPGSGYSVILKILIPGETGLRLYDYNPLVKSLTLIAEIPSQNPSNWIRLICVGESVGLKKRYNIIPYRLLLIETGVILQQLSLVSAYLGLKSKIIGYTNEKILKKTFEGHFTPDQKILGEFLVTKAAVTK